MKEINDIFFEKINVFSYIICIIYIERFDDINIILPKHIFGCTGTIDKLES